MVGGEKISARRTTDVISNMPENVRDAILVRLPLCDAARMSVLSHTWFDIWTSISQLNFDEQFFSTILRRQRRLDFKPHDIISKILFEHDGPVIKFSLVVLSHDVSLRVNQWIAYLSSLEIKDLSLKINSILSPLQLNSCLFHCHDLEMLELHRCTIRTPPKFEGLMNLRSLVLDKVKLRGNAAKDLLTTSPLLEKLSLRSCSGVTDIIFDAPNLSCLIVDGAFNSIHIRKAENLISAFIGFPEERFPELLISSLQTLARACNLEVLGFRGRLSKVFFNYASRFATVFEKVKNLEFSSIELLDFEDFSTFTRTIQRCPRVEVLNITVMNSKNLDARTLDLSTGFKLNHLTCANAKFSVGTSVELRLIKFLLASSPILETLSVGFTKPITQGFQVDITKPITQAFQVEMLQQLNGFPRASQKAKIIFPQLILLPQRDSSSSSSYDDEDNGEGESS